MTAVPTQRNLSRYDGIQFLRFVAAGVVLIAHATIYCQERLDPQVLVWRLGGAGVDIFFVISGFVIVLAARGKQPHSWVDCRSFLAKRALRIFPMYWAATTLNLLIMLMMPAIVIGSSFHLGDVVKWYLLIPTRNDAGRIEPLLGVGWTLYFETFFYLLFALALAMRRSPLLVVPPILILVAMVSPFRQSSWPAMTIYFDPKVLEFLVGMLIARSTELFRIPPKLGLLLVASGVILFFGSDSLRGWTEFVARAGFSGLLVAGFVSLEPILAGQFGKTSLFLGAASYALYLTHPIAGPSVPALLHKLHLNWPLVSILGTIVVSLAVGAFAHRFFESPLMEVGSAGLRRPRQVAA